MGLLLTRKIHRTLILLLICIHFKITAGNEGLNISRNENTLYPDLRCHKGYYNGSDYVNKRGEKWILLISNMCKRLEKENQNECYKKCVFRWNGVLWWQPKSLSPASCMAGDFKRNFFADEEILADSETTSSARQIANKIVGSCSSIYDAVRNFHCSEWTPFYQCVDKSWECPV